MLNGSYQGGRVDDGFLLRALLAGNVADCSFSPPLLPTQCAIMRALALFGVLGLRELSGFIPCSRETLLQQLCRLHAVGLVQRERVQVGGRSVRRYALTHAGALAVRRWSVCVRRALARFDDLLQLLSDDESY